ncbi:hypothetical protein Efla_001368 [Eimeria flavescens]
MLRELSWGKGGCENINWLAAMFSVVESVTSKSVDLLAGIMLLATSEQVQQHSFLEFLRPLYSYLALNALSSMQVLVDIHVLTVTHEAGVLTLERHPMQFEEMREMALFFCMQNVHLHSETYGEDQGDKCIRRDLASALVDDT